MNRLVLIDGNAILHRAYHALPPLTGPDGSMVNAVYGFVSMLLKIFNELKPTHMAVAFDRPEPTFRKELFVDYQAKRPQMPSDLVPQVEKVKDVTRVFGIPIFEAAGFEADDVLGSLVKQATDEHMMEKSRANHVPLSSAHQAPEVVIVTGDRDLLQLVDDRTGIKVYMPIKGLSEGKLFGEEEVVEKIGVSPEQIPDFKALAGDASDNYPGVAGIGPKTAVKLLRQYGTVEKVIESGELGEKAKSASLSKQLATILTGIPIEVDFEKTRVSSLDSPRSREALEALGFKSLLKRLTSLPKEKSSPKQTSQQQQLF